MDETQAVPKIETINLTSGKRALGRMIDLNLEGIPENETQSVKDLTAEAFWTYYDRPNSKEEIPQERIINRKLLDWALASPGWEQGHLTTWGSLLSSQYAAEILSTQLMGDPAIRKAIEKQEKAQEKREEAQEKTQESDKNKQEAQKARLQGNTPKADEKDKAAKEAQKQAKQAQAQAQQAQDKAEETIEKFQESRMGKATRALAVKAAKDGADEIAAAMTGWGIDPSTVTTENIGEIAQLLKDKGSAINEIAGLIGRVKGIALARKSKSKSAVIITEVGYTRDLAKVFPTELAWLRSDAPEILRAQKAAEYCSRGLLGSVCTADAVKEGKLVMAVDDSGSMGCGVLPGVTRTVLAKALALGIAQAANENGQKFEAFRFSEQWGNYPAITHDSTKREVFGWAEECFGGGTNFDGALAYAIDAIDTDSEDADNADIVMISDGECGITDKTIQRYFDLKDRRGTRLIFLQIGNETYGDITKIATVTTAITPEDTLDTLAERLVDALKRTEV